MTNKQLFKTSEQGENLIKGFEALRLKAYLDMGGLPTIGWGTTIYPNGVEVKLGDTCTKEQAEIYFKHDLSRFEFDINNKLKVNVKQNQFDALVSHWYNTGGSNTIISMINNKADMDLICQWWCSHYITASGKLSNGLVSRRMKESKIFSA
jgi:lysozyme